MAPTIRTCSLAIAAALAASGPAGATVTFLRSGASTFVAARAAADAGDARRAAILYASLAAADPADGIVASRALAQAILAGDMTLALRLARARPAQDLTPDARLLLVADQLRHGRGKTVEPAALPRELSFIDPFVRAWTHAGRRDWRQAVAVLDAVSVDNLLHQAVPEQKALILLAAGRSGEARPLFETALGRAGGRAVRLRIAFASALIRDGDRAGGLALLQGRGVTLTNAAARLGRERKPELVIGTPAEGFAELLTGLAISLGDSDSRALPLALVQVARHADPRNAQTAILLGLLRERSERPDDAVAVLRSVGEDSPFVSEARDAEIRSLLRSDRQQEALARAQALVTGDALTADDWSRLGDVFSDLDRHGEAADAYARALVLAEAGGPGPEVWSLHLLRGGALEEANRWAEAEPALERAHALEPGNPLVLNYLGYARLERGEQLDEAEAMIAEASRRAPNDASITDSLGWAQYKRGKLSEAIATLQRAAAADPGQAEIHEHLGDALYAAGRQFEARFAWNAALVTAEEEVRKRVEVKLTAGLTRATAAP